jgi:hypothetical protein
MSLRPLADRLRRLPLFDLWPGARPFRRDSDRLEWYGWVAAALVCALAVPLALVVGLQARSALADTARQQRAERVLVPATPGELGVPAEDPDGTIVAWATRDGRLVGAPMGALEVDLYAAGAALAVDAAAVGAAAAGLWATRRRLVRRRDLEWTMGWRAVSTSWARDHGISDKS